jgi:phospholipase A1
MVSNYTPLRFPLEKHPNDNHPVRCPVKRPLLLLIPVALSVTPVTVKATPVDDCFAKALRDAEPEATAEMLRGRCEETAELPERLREERLTEQNEFVISPYKPNYILPYSIVAEPNQAPYNLAGNYGVQDPMQDHEAKFQISIKAPLTFTPLLTDNDGIFAAFTLVSYWQVYNSDISAPFRETNYQPEIFYRTVLPWKPSGGTVLLTTGLEHQSNGRTQYLSRSWNRAYFKLGYLKPDWAVALRPWYRFDEDEKVDDGDPTTPPPSQGDDNPDIEDYMGHYELQGVYTLNKVEFTAMTRYNFATGYGSAEVGVSFPLYGKLKGYVQYFNGYGESLIDYNARMERLGVGILLTDWY